MDEMGDVARAGQMAQAAVTDRRWRKVTALLSRIALYALVVILSFFFALPLLWMISTSIKTDPQVYHVPPVWIPNPVRLLNYPEALAIEPFGLYFVNTMRYALPTVLGTVASSLLVAYSFAKIRWWGRDVIFFACIATMMIPYQVIMIPLYILFTKIGWVNSYKPLVVPAFLGNAYYIFMLRQFLLTIPEELSDAARVDGCNRFAVLWRILAPLCRPALAVVALFQFMGAWNDYLGPLIYLNRQELYPLALGLQQMRSSFATYPLQWPYIMAASTMIAAPVILLFFFTQRTFVEGITITGIKM